MSVDVSLIVPVYFNEGALADTFAAIRDQVVARHPHRVFEIIFIDDGSQDRSLEVLLQLRAQYPQWVTVIQLTRNFGQLGAIRAGFEHARGQAVVVMSADGQDPPELINEMIREHFENHHEIVLCHRTGRDESRYRIWTSRLFYAFMRRFCFPNMPAGGFDYFLLGRHALQSVLANRESHSFLQGQILWTGYQPKCIGYHRRQRQSGTSRWTFGKKLTYLIDGVMGYSFLPIRLASLLGVLFSVLGFAYALVIFVLKILGGIPMKGWAPLMMMILILGGIQMLVLGIIGEYVWRTLAQSRQRPPYLIARVYDKDAPAACAPEPPRA